jgi:hypothetical protein
MQSLFVPEAQRRGLLALLALNLELKRIPGLVTEEMIAHIRYAWWRETLEGLYAGSRRAGQPVLEELQPLIEAGHIPQAALMALVDAYATPYPEKPAGAQEALENAADCLLQSTAPTALKPWRKAGGIIGRHRRRYKERLQGWLALKLLLAGW